jgi:hypothetical protein
MIYVKLFRVIINGGTNRKALTIKAQKCTQLESTKTGNWNDPSTWSCGYIPTIFDDVLLKNGHTITLPPSIQGECKKLFVETGGVFDAKSKLIFGNGN